jgi:hypothetical protein
MSALPKAMRAMRIITLPLSRPKIPPDRGLKPHAVFNPNRMLIFYHFDLSQGNSVNSQDQSAIKRAVKWVSTKAADLWAGFGKAPEGSWKAGRSPLKCCVRASFSKYLGCLVANL